MMRSFIGNKTFIATKNISTIIATLLIMLISCTAYAADQQSAALKPITNQATTLFTTSNQNPSQSNSPSLKSKQHTNVKGLNAKKTQVNNVQVNNLLSALQPNGNEKKQVNQYSASQVSKIQNKTTAPAAAQTTVGTSPKKPSGVLVQYNALYAAAQSRPKTNSNQVIYPNQPNSSATLNDAMQPYCDVQKYGALCQSQQQLGEGLGLNSSEFGIKGPFSFSFTYSHELGAIFNPQFTVYLSKYNAISFLLGIGEEERRANITWGHQLYSNQRFKITYEFLEQKLPFSFASGDVEEWIRQNAVAFDYEILFKQSWFRSLDLNGRYVKAKSKKLSSVLFQNNGLYFVNLRNIAGGEEEQGKLQATLLPSHTFELQPSINYGYLKYDRIYEPDQKDSKVGYGLYLTKLFSSKFKVNLGYEDNVDSSTFNAAIKAILPAHLELALASTIIHGLGGLPDDQRYTLAVNYPAPNQYSLDYNDGFSPLNVWTATPAVFMNQVLAIKDEAVVALYAGVRNIGDQTIFIGQYINSVDTHKYFIFPSGQYDDVKYQVFILNGLQSPSPSPSPTLAKKLVAANMSGNNNQPPNNLNGLGLSFNKYDEMNGQLRSFEPMPVGSLGSYKVTIEAQGIKNGQVVSTAFDSFNLNVVDTLTPLVNNRVYIVENNAVVNKAQNVYAQVNVTAQGFNDVVYRNINGIFSKGTHLVTHEKTASGGFNFVQKSATPLAPSYLDVSLAQNHAHLCKVKFSVKGNAVDVTSDEPNTCVVKGNRIIVENIPQEVLPPEVPKWSNTVNLPFATQNQSYSLSLASKTYIKNYIKAGGPSITFKFADGKSEVDGLTLMPDGTFSGKPLKTGTFELKVTAGNTKGVSIPEVQTLYLTVQNLSIVPPEVPKWSKDVNLPMATETHHYTLSLASKTYITNYIKAGGPSIAFMFADGKSEVNGLTLSSDGTLSGTPSKAGKFEIEVTAQNAKGVSIPEVQKLYLTVQNLSIVPPEVPKWSNKVNLPIATQNINYTLSLSSETYITNYFKAGGPAITFEFASGNNKVDGLTLSSDGTLSGTPLQTGTFKIKVTAQNAKGVSIPEVQQFNLTVQTISTIIPPEVPKWSDKTELPQGTAGTAYKQVDLDTPQYIKNFKQAGGRDITFEMVKPKHSINGLMLSKHGVLSGTPKKYGSYRFYVTAKNPKGGSIPEQKVLTIKIMPILPQWTMGKKTQDMRYRVGKPFSVDLKNYIKDVPHAGVLQFGTKQTGKLKKHGLTLSIDGVLSSDRMKGGHNPPVFQFQVTVTNAAGMAKGSFLLAHN